jgi:ankyrin repeat protein
LCHAVISSWMDGRRGSAGIEVIRQLLAHGANPNLGDRWGETPLILAQGCNRPDIVALLKRYGTKESKHP